MSWTPKLVVSDLDGTLLHRWKMSDRTWAAIEGTRKAGVGFLFATGRSAAFLQPLLDRGYDGLVVCDNGALVFDIAADVARHEHLIPADVLSAVVADFSDVVPEGYYAVNRTRPDPRIRLAEPRMVERWGFGYEPLPRERLGDEPAGKLTVRVPDLPSDVLADRLEPVAAGRVTVTWSTVSEGLIECSAPGVTKVTGAALVAAELGVDPADVLAMGDMNNDLAMLRWAGHSVAPANAHPSVLAVVDEVVGHIADDGTAAYLERLLSL